MVAKDYVPARGDIVWLDFTPQAGHEQMGRRPALAIFPKSYNERVGLGLFCPITTKEKGYPFEVGINNRQISGVVLSDQIKSLDWGKRNIEYITRAKREELEEVIAKIKVLIIEEG